MMTVDSSVCVPQLHAGLLRHPCLYDDDDDNDDDERRRRI